MAVNFAAIKGSAVGDLALGGGGGGGYGGRLGRGAGLTGINGARRRNARLGCSLLRRRDFRRPFSIEINAGKNQDNGNQHQSGDDLGKIFHKHKIVIAHKTPVWAAARIRGKAYYIGAWVLNKAVIASIFNGK